jgi:hypothetical protein
MFQKRLENDRSLDSILAFFDGLKAQEPRYRWDRIVVLHLLLMVLVNRFGRETQYKAQCSTEEEFLEVAKRTRNSLVLRNFVKGLDKLGLKKDREVRRIKRAVNQILPLSSSASAAPGGLPFFTGRVSACQKGVTK